MLTGGIEAADGKSILSAILRPGTPGWLTPPAPAKACVGHRHVGRLRPSGDIMVEIAVEHLGAQIGAHAARIVQQRQRLAIFGGAAVAHRERMRDKAEPVGLERAAERQQEPSIWPPPRLV